MSSYLPKNNVSLVNGTNNYMGKKKIAEKNENGPVWPQQHVWLHEVGNNIKVACIKVSNKRPNT